MWFLAGLWRISLVLFLLVSTAILASAWYPARQAPMAIKAATRLMNPLTADGKELQGLLRSGALTSVDLLDIYTKQIRKYDDYLRAMISSAPDDVLIKAAQSLDQERAEGKLRGPLHGIPVLIKDNIETHPNLKMKTTAGSLALVDTMPKGNAKIVDMLIAAGAIILGKCNLSELANWKGTNITSGWSAVRGQTQSAYTRGDVDPDDGKDGHSNPSGSSSGPAVAVSAGYAPISIGTETDGSLIAPAGRAALYTIKPTIGLVSQEGIIPVSHSFDAAGPMAKTPYDVAIILDAIANPDPLRESYTTALTGSWSDISIATLDPETWIFPHEWMRPVAEATEQMNTEYREAYAKIKSLAKHVADEVPLIDPLEAFNYMDDNSELVITDLDFVEGINNYLAGCEGAKVKSLRELIEFNKVHAAEELPAYAPNQNHLERAYGRSMTKEEYQKHFDHLRDVSRTRGIDHTLDKYNADVIMAPADSLLISMATGSGYPIATLPLSYLKYNGRPFGLAIIARAHQDALLIKVQSAWEQTFGLRQPPTMND